MEKVKTMKQLAEDYALLYGASGSMENDDAYRSFLAGFEAATNQWISVEKIDNLTTTRLSLTDDNLIMCLYDDGEIRRWKEKTPVAIMTHVLFLPKLPLK